MSVQTAISLYAAAKKKKRIAWKAIKIHCHFNLELAVTARASERCSGKLDHLRRYYVTVFAIYDRFGMLNI